MSASLLSSGVTTTGDAVIHARRVARENPESPPAYLVAAAAVGGRAPLLP